MLFVATVYTHLANFHLPFMRMLQGWGCEVHAAASPDEGRREEVEALGVICHDVPFARSLLSLRNWRAYREMRALLKREPYQLIHVHTPVAGWLGRLAARRSGQGPVLYTVHGFHFFKGAPWSYWLLFYPLELLASRWTDGLVVLNEEDFERAKKMGFSEGEDLFFVHGVGVDIEDYRGPVSKGAALRGELGVRDEEQVVVCVAEFSPTKNHAQILGAWPHVLQEIPGAHVVFVGEGRTKVTIEQQAARARLANVHFLGFRADVPEILSASDVFVLPSRREGLPLSVMEAMAAGKPVVATDVRGSRALVEDGVNGFLVSVDDHERLAHALVRLLQDPALRKRMGEAGRVRVYAYALPRVLGEMKEVYQLYWGTGKDDEGGTS